MAPVSVASPPPVVLVPFLCPLCHAANGAALRDVSRAEGVQCASCARWLRSSQVARAMQEARGR